MLVLLRLDGTPPAHQVRESEPAPKPCWRGPTTSKRAPQLAPGTRFGSLFLRGGSPGIPPCPPGLPPAPSGAGSPSVRWPAGTFGG